MFNGSVNKKFIQHFSQHDSKMLHEMLGWFAVTYTDKKNKNGNFSYAWRLCQAFIVARYELC